MIGPRWIRCYGCTSEYELDLPKCPRCGLKTTASEGYELTDAGHRTGSRALALLVIGYAVVTVAGCVYAFLG